MPAQTPIRVWDLPIRLFHWLLVGLFAFSWWSAENGVMDWHRLSGLTILGLLVFRIVWGIIGSNTARFAAFVKSPAQAIAYIKGAPDKTAGHNALGGYSVIALLALMLAQVVSGLFAVDVDGLESGPLSYLISFDQGRVASELHEVSFNLLMALIGLHVLAILYYRFIRRRNLVTPMITGRDSELDADTAGLIPAPLWRLLPALAIAAALAWWVSKGLPF